MPIKLNYRNKLNNYNDGNYVIFVSENPNFGKLNAFFTKTEVEIIAYKFKERNSKKNFLSFDVSAKKSFILVKTEKIDYPQNLGAEFFNYLKQNDYKNVNVLFDSNSNLELNFINNFLHGIRLKSYEFNLYKSEIKNNLISFNIISKHNIQKLQLKYNAIEEGTNFARDLVSEPPNVLFPGEYVARLIRLRKLGIKVTVYNEKKLKNLGMNSLLGVGKGSAKESYLVTLEWYGNKSSKSSPLSFVGKGVCFDTGGISLKPAKFMEEMKYDMAGSAVVSGLIQSLAIRKAKVNAVGVVGLVENMPGGNAQRPGDIVKAYNGTTIEVLNTDAEGRLVLADALSFTEKKFKPKFIIDLATLTGAIIVALGEEYAGLFSNNDDLSKKLSDAGEKVNEKVW